ncbi:lysoplasmalogenase [Lutibacter sp. A64]|uniref:lysoplasmalogenase n=1 Tax=Lutibacter sp. A64 TaxID=2918526 RepID=UPI001F064EB5|nr:lysoplasmalogenase [Lutibacter sp. A64]UMB53895.1 lysoplasmalogenase [Lutibacter sp. A64]
MVRKIALYVFLLVSILDVVGIIFKIDTFVLIFKPLILLSLLFLYAHSVEEKNKWYVMALIFSFFGDVFLLYAGDTVFKFGLSSFLIAHLLFIAIVIKQIKKASIVKVLVAIIPFAIIVVGLLFLLKNSLKELMIPVIIYAITIATFGIVSMLNYMNVKSKKALLMLIGAIVFVASDAILAINKFYYSALVFQITVMVTYITAQYFIYKSMVLVEDK